MCEHEFRPIDAAHLDGAPRHRVQRVHV
jgi:hypothetical protein